MTYPVRLPEPISHESLPTTARRILVTRRIEGCITAPDPFRTDETSGAPPPGIESCEHFVEGLKAALLQSDPQLTFHMIEDYADLISFWVCPTYHYSLGLTGGTGLRPSAFVRVTAFPGEADVIQHMSVQYAAVHSGQADIIEAVCAGITEHAIVETPRTNEAYMMVRAMGELSLRRCNHPHTPLQPDCYTAPVLQAWAEVREQTLAESPSARLGLLSGPPGTGKTYLIRSLLGDLQYHTLIIIPAGLIDSVSGPDLMAVLLDQHSAGSPMILVCEDADRALAKRTKRSSSATALSELLNLTDGLMGTLLDLRVVATTNLPDIDLDPAIIRPGRMSAHVRTTALPRTNVEALCARLGIVPPSDVNELTVAEVYALQRSPV